MSLSNSVSRLLWPVLILFVLLFTGIGVMLWFAPVPDGELTQIQTNLANVADWMVKMSMGAIIGLVAGSARTLNGG